MVWHLVVFRGKFAGHRTEDQLIDRQRAKNKLTILYIVQNVNCTAAVLVRVANHAASTFLLAFQISQCQVHTIDLGSKEACASAVNLASSAAAFVLDASR